MNNSYKYLKSKYEIAAELYANGKITRPECFRNEVDFSVGEDTCAIRINPNTSETTT